MLVVLSLVHINPVNYTVDVVHCLSGQINADYNKRRWPNQTGKRIKHVIKWAVYIFMVNAEGSRPRECNKGILFTSKDHTVYYTRIILSS